MMPAEPVSFTSQKSRLALKDSLDTARTRLLMCAAVFIFAIVMIGGRLADLTLLRAGGEPPLADQEVLEGLNTGRADIVDRNGIILATTITTTSIYANAKQIQNPEEAAKKLITVLPQLKYEAILKRLQSSKSFIWVARHLTPHQKEKILRLGIPGINFIQDQRRIYPQGNLASHVLGFTNVDNQGIAGVEKSMDFVLSRKEDPLALSLDVRVQHIVRNEILNGMEEFHAEGGSGMVIDIHSGEVVAMVSFPDFNPNQPTHYNKDFLFNKITLGTYEMGSTLKIANVAMALEANVATLNTVFDVTQPLHVGKFKITDNHPKGRPLNVAEIFVYSSNIGSAQLALKAGIHKQKSFLKKLGYLDPAAIELHEVGVPLVPKLWKEASSITISYGYGLSITPLHLASSIATLVGGGCKVSPTLLKLNDPPLKGDRVISEENSRKILQLMRYVVSDGTARKANVQEYFVGGKTGTRQKLTGRKYNKDRVVTSFVGVVGESIDKPKYVLFLALDDPKALKKTYGFNAAGWNAAVVAHNIISRMSPILGLMPRPLNYEETPEPYFQNISFGSKHEAH
jgi:cell division protein FtsI (penicillin-binding protein 3)